MSICSKQNQKYFDGIYAWNIMSRNDTWLNDMRTNDGNRKEMVNMMFERI